MLASIRCSVIAQSHRASRMMAAPRLCQPTRFRTKSAKRIDTSKVPILNESDLEENFISGSGPGGQCVNKSVNCCQLKHKPSGIVVRVHQTRSLIENRKIARELLISRLDDFYNAEQSVSAQKRRLALSKLANQEAQDGHRRALKQQYKQNVSNDDKSNQKKDYIYLESDQSGGNHQR